MTAFDPDRGVGVLGALASDPVGHFRTCCNAMRSHGRLDTASAFRRLDDPAAGRRPRRGRRRYRAASQPPRHVPTRPRLPPRGQTPQPAGHPSPVAPQFADQTAKTPDSGIANDFASSCPRGPSVGFRWWELPRRVASLSRMHGRAVRRAWRSSAWLQIRRRTGYGAAGCDGLADGAADELRR